jgi:hypothetical protein
MKAHGDFRRLIFCLPLLLGLACLVSACATSVQAPYDAFVCFNASFNSCLAQAQSSRLKSFVSTAFPRLNSGPIIADPDAGKHEATKDNKYSCDYSSVSYSQKIKPDDLYGIVFVSPVILNEVGEQQILITQARDGCHRVVQAYDYEGDVLKLQDQLSTTQSSQSRLSAIIDAQRNSKDGVGGDADPKPVTGETPGTSERDALQAAQTSAVGLAETLREKYKDETVNITFAQRFEDAQRQIDAQLRELGRELFVLDRATVDQGNGNAVRGRYSDGSWVAKGTIVGTIFQ